MESQIYLPSGHGLPSADVATAAAAVTTSNDVNLSQLMAACNRDDGRSGGGGSMGIEKPLKSTISLQWKSRVKELIFNLCDKNHLSEMLAFDACCFFLTKVVPKIKTSHIFSVDDVSAFSIYAILEQQHVYKTINDVVLRFGGTAKNLFALERLISQHKVDENPPSIYSPSLFARLSLRHGIRRKIEILADEFYEFYRLECATKPECILAACTYFICSERKRQHRQLRKKSSFCNSSDAECRPTNKLLEDPTFFPSWADLTSMKTVAHFFGVSLSSLCRLSKKVRHYQQQQMAHPFVFNEQT